MSLLEKQHLRLITAESLWVNTCNPACGFQSWNIGCPGRRFGQEWWEAIPLAKSSILLCSCFCCLQRSWAYTESEACYQCKGRTVRVTVLPHPAVLEKSEEETLNSGCMWMEKWSFGILNNFLLTTLITTWSLGNIAGFVSILGRCRCVIIPSFPFGAWFLTRMLFLHHLLLWWWQELKSSGVGSREIRTTSSFKEMRWVDE